jgi:hypothetical protein
MSTVFDLQMGSSFVPIDIPDDIYDATIVDVSGLIEQEDTYKGGIRKFFTIDWEILIDLVPEGTTLRTWQNIPDTGRLNEKATLYQLMEAFELVTATGKFRLDLDFFPGKQARVIVEKKKNQNTGEVRPKITGIKAKRKPVAAARPTGKPGLRERLAADDDD